MKESKQKKSFPAWALFLIIAIAGLCFGVGMAFLCVHEGWIKKPESSSQTSDVLQEGEVLGYCAYKDNFYDGEIGTIYLVESMLTTSNVNPKTGKLFTEKEIANIKSGSNTAHLDEGYAMGITTPKGLQEGINEYTESEAKRVLPLFYKNEVMMDTESGSLYTVKDGESEFLVEHCISILISVMDEEGNIGRVYYPVEYIDTQHINPYTSKPFDEEEVASLLTNAETWILYDGVHMMIEPFNTGALWSYAGQDAANIAGYNGHINLNPTSGQITTDDKLIIATAMENNE